jgi:hypothetical protein
MDLPLREIGFEFYGILLFVSYCFYKENLLVLQQKLAHPSIKPNQVKEIG